MTIRLTSVSRYFKFDFISQQLKIHWFTSVCSSEMIPFNEHIDYAWSEFERYSTNSYIRQLLDSRAAVLAGGMTGDIT